MLPCINEFRNFFTVFKIILIDSYLSFSKNSCIIMFQNVTLSESHPFVQELTSFATNFGELSKDPVKSFTDIFSRYPAMMYLKERMRNASSGR